jgi:hypothetical protein
MAQVAAVTVRHPGIRRLNVKGVEWPEGTLHAALGGMTALEVLRLGGTALSDSSLSVLATLRTLRRVDISNATLGRYGSVSARGMLWKAREELSYLDLMPLGTLCTLRQRDVGRCSGCLVCCKTLAPGLMP